MKVWKEKDKIPFTEAYFMPTAVPLHLSFHWWSIGRVVESPTYFLYRQDGLDMMELKRKLTDHLQGTKRITQEFL